MGNPRFDAWLASLDNPMTPEEVAQYIWDFKSLDSAVHLGDGWWFAGPLDDPFGTPWNGLYQVLHESGRYSQELLIDKAADGSDSDYALRWAREEVNRGEHALSRQ